MDLLLAPLRPPAPPRPAQPRAPQPLHRSELIASPPQARAACCGRGECGPAPGHPTPGKEIRAGAPALGLCRPAWASSRRRSLESSECPGCCHRGDEAPAPYRARPGVPAPSSRRAARLGPRRLREGRGYLVSPRAASSCGNLRCQPSTGPHAGRRQGPAPN